MIPAQIDFPMWKNSSYREDLQFNMDGLPFDLTSLDFIFTIKNFNNADVTLLSFGIVDQGQGLQIEIPIAGIITLVIDWPTINNLYQTLNSGKNSVPAVASYDLVAVHLDDFREIWTQGLITINSGV